MEHRAVFANTEVRYKEFIDHIKMRGTGEEFSLAHSEVSKSQLEEFLPIRNRLLEFHSKADDIKRERNKLPSRQGKKNHDAQIEVVKVFCTQLIVEMESFRYSIQNTEFFPNIIGELDNLIIGCRKVYANPYDRMPL